MKADYRNVDFYYNNNWHIYLYHRDYYIVGFLVSTFRNHSKEILIDYLSRPYRSKLSSSLYTYEVKPHRYGLYRLNNFSISKLRCVCSCRHCGIQVVHLVIKYQYEVDAVVWKGVGGRFRWHIGRCN